jgi:hypothetical protein
MNSKKEHFFKFQFPSTSNVASDSSNLDESSILPITINTSQRYYSCILFIAHVAFEIKTETNITSNLK